MHIQDFSSPVGPVDAAAGFVEDAVKVSGNNFVQRQQYILFRRKARKRVLGQPAIEVCEGQWTLPTENQLPFHDIFQFANIAGPGIMHQLVNGFGVQVGYRVYGQLLGFFLNKMIYQGGDVPFSGP